MMRFHARAGLTRVTMLLSAALLTAAQFLVFLTPSNRLDAAAGGSAQSPDADRVFNRTYGNVAARFTLIEYADLECPYCARSFAEIRRWIDAHSDVNWEWRYLPLSMHEPRATQAARWVECVGQTQGNRAFWAALAEHYARPRGQALASEHHHSLSEALRACLKSRRPDAIVRAHAEEAYRGGIQATPTLILTDRQSGKTVTLQGAPNGDTLLSALDALAAASVP